MSESESTWRVVRVLIVGRPVGPDAKAWVSVAQHHYFDPKRWKMKPMTASSVAEATLLLERYGPFDVVFLDKTMASPDAEQVAKACAAQKDPPAILLDYGHAVLGPDFYNLRLETAVSVVFIADVVQRRLDRLAAREQASS